MRKSIFIMVLLLAGSITVMAQGGGFQRRTVAERVERTHHVLDSALKLDAAKLTQTDSVFAKYYRATDKLRDEMREAGQGFQGMREKMQPLMDERDKELKAILNDDQYKKWKDEIEPAMRPRGGGNRQN